MAGQQLSAQDIQDLQEIRKRLPQGDPRGGKIDTLITSIGPSALGGANPQDVTSLGPPGMNTPQDIQRTQMRALGEGALMSTMQPAAAGDIMLGSRLAGPIMRGTGRLAESMGKGLSWAETHGLPRILTPSKGWGRGVQELGQLMQRYTPDLKTPFPFSKPPAPAVPPSIPEAELITPRLTQQAPRPSVSRYQPQEIPEVQAPKPTQRPLRRQMMPEEPTIPLAEQMDPGRPVATRSSELGRGVPQKAPPQPSAPRPSLIKQMGGRPVEEITDQALKQKMEQSSELTYGLNAKRHAGPSKSYPEPAEWQDQAPENAPWGGQFYRR